MHTPMPLAVGQLPWVRGGSKASSFVGKREVVGIWCQLLPVMRQRGVQRALKRHYLPCGQWAVHVCVREEGGMCCSGAAHSDHVK